MKNDRLKFDRDGFTGAVNFAPDIAAVTPSADDRPRVLVAICHNVGVVERVAAQSLIEIGWGNRIQRVKDDLGIASIDLAWFTMLPRVDALRNVALEQAMRDDFTHVIFLDGDMVFPTNVLHQLLRHIPRQAVVSGFYTQRRYPFHPIALRAGKPHESGLFNVYQSDGDYTDVDEHGLREEEVIGMGCALIPLHIVRAMGPRPWFEYRDDADGWPMITEDVPFCERVRAAGFAIYLDPAIKCGHLFHDVATEAHWQRYVTLDAQAKERLKNVVSISLDGDPAAPDLAAVEG